MTKKIVHFTTTGLVLEDRLGAIVAKLETLAAQNRHLEARIAHINRMVTGLTGSLDLVVDGLRPELFCQNGVMACIKSFPMCISDAGEFLHSERGILKAKADKNLEDVKDRAARAMDFAAARRDPMDPLD